MKQNSRALRQFKVRKHIFITKVPHKYRQALSSTKQSIGWKHQSYEHIYLSQT